MAPRRKTETVALEKSLKVALLRPRHLQPTTEDELLKSLEASLKKVA